LPDTLIEVWQANNAGQYDTDKPSNFTERVDFRLRGMMLTDQQGNYEFETIMPGRYPIPPNMAAFRPRNRVHVPCAACRVSDKFTGSLRI
jgi:protocatechuate 3,4-dioxygenase beta subunit